MRPDRIPFFPLNVVLFPGEQLPLHIFEPRYRRMVRECFDGQISLRHAPRHERWRHPRRLHRRNPRSRQALSGRPHGHHDRRPRAVPRSSNSSPRILSSKGQSITSKTATHPIDPKTQHQLVEIYEACHTLIFGSLPRDVEHAPADELSYAIASSLPIDLLWKQQILELRSESDRQERLLRYLRDWAPHLLKEKTLRQSASGNGHGLN